MRRDREDPERRPSAAQQLAGLALFAPLPIDTRRAAQEALAERVPRLRAAALEALRALPQTADEVAAAMGESILAVRPRLSELHVAGLIHDTGLRRANASGRSAIVWRAR